MKSRMHYVLELEGFRGLLALWVVLGHWAASLPFHVPVSASLFNVYAVHVFILLSGFVIAFLLRNSPESYGRYLMRRAVRLAPAYFLYLIAAVFLLDFTIDTLRMAPPTPANIERLEIAREASARLPMHVVLHALGMQSAVPLSLLPRSEYTLLGQAWSISLEWQFYIVAPFIMLLLTTAWRRSSIAWIAIIAVFCVATTPYMPRGYLGGFLPVFAIGIGSYFVLEALHNDILPSSGRLYLAATVFMVVYLVMLSSWAALPYVLWTVMMGVLLINRTSPTPLTLGVSRLLDIRPIQMLGRLSYSIYLSHMFALIAGMRILAPYRLNVAAYSLILLAITLAGTGIISAIVYRWIEQPMIDWGKRRWKRPAPPAAANTAG